MSGKISRFADDGWAVWIEGDDTSTFYLDEWVNPNGKSYVDVAVNIRDIDDTHGIFVYVPFPVEKDEIEDISTNLGDPNIFHAVFSSTGMVDLWKNRCTSAIAYHGRVVDLVHISELEVGVRRVSSGTLISLSIDDFAECLDGDEIYIFFRIPHKSLDEVFVPAASAASLLTRLKSLFVSPIVLERYGCSVRVNEVRMLPPEIAKTGMLHRQKLNLASVSIHLKEDYQIRDANCHRVHRLEKDLYRDHAPQGFDLDDVIVYHWQQAREINLRGCFNFYFDIHREKVSGGSILIYSLALLAMGIVGNAVYDGLVYLLKTML
ncbi:MAG: hypothetical protein IKV48_04525 [Eggerthellaceae bacterium]|nr:hypothetical protein [Eggerthellaceae bacterium]